MSNEELVKRVTDATDGIAKLARVSLFASDATYIDHHDLPVDVQEYLQRMACLDEDVMKLLKKKMKAQISGHQQALSRALNDLDLLPMPDVRKG